MKKLFLIVAALFVAVSFSACSDDDENSVNMTLLYGSWQEMRSYGYALENGKKVDEWDEQVDEVSIYSFNEYGSGSYNNSQVHWDIHYTQNGNKLQLVCTGDGETYNYTWTINKLSNTEMSATQYSKRGDYEEFDTMVFKRVN